MIKRHLNAIHKIDIDKQTADPPNIRNILVLTLITKAVTLTKARSLEIYRSIASVIALSIDYRRQVDINIKGMSSMTLNVTSLLLSFCLHVQFTVVLVYDYDESIYSRN